MKYLLLMLTLAMTACSKPEPKIFYCMSALTPLGGIQVDTSSPDVKQNMTSLELTTEQGNTVIIPKSLCVEVKRAEGN